MPPKNKLKLRRTPRQSRAQATLAIIYEAALKVLTTLPIQSYTTNRVAEVAGVSVGSLYQYFPTRDALTIELIRWSQARFLDNFRKLADKAAGLSYNVGSIKLVDALLDYLPEVEKLELAMGYRSANVRMHPRLQEIPIGIGDAMAQFMKVHFPDLPDRTLKEIGHDIYYIVTGIGTGLWEQGVARKQIMRRALNAVSGYMLKLRKARA